MTALINHERNASTAYETARHEYEQSKRIVTAETATQRQHIGEKSYREEWRAERDLEAQRLMAWWSRIAGIATCIGVALLAATLWETTRTTIAAAEAADAAKLSAEISERALLATQRPIVAIERFDNFATAANDRVIAWTFRAYIKNTGNSEAINFRNHINLTIRNDDLPDNFTYPDIASTRPAAGSVITAKQENQFLSFVIEIDHALAIYRGDRRMFFYGWLEYDDVFEGTKRHRTEFCYKIGFPNDPLNTTFHKPMSFDPYGTRYNHIDKDCLYAPDSPPPQEPPEIGPGVLMQ